MNELMNNLNTNDGFEVDVDEDEGMKDEDQMTSSRGTSRETKRRCQATSVGAVKSRCAGTCRCRVQSSPMHLKGEREEERKEASSADECNEKVVKYLN